MTPLETAVAGGWSRDACARLTPFGWRGGLVVIALCLAALFILLGYFVDYWRNDDMDFMIVYSALAANDGLAPAFFDHPAYLTILTVEGWFAFMHRLGLLTAWSLSRIPSAADVPAFDAAMTSAVRAARLVSFATGMMFILAFAELSRRLVRDWRVALLATFAFAFSGGLQIQMRILRSEMIAACLPVLAFMMLILVARSASSWRPLAVGLASALCVLGLENKIQAILLIAALPALILPFGARAGASVAAWRQGGGRWLALGAATLSAGALIAVAWPLLHAGLRPGPAADALVRRPLLGSYGVYQGLLAVWIGIAMAVFAAIWRVSVAETLTAVGLAIAGAALGLLALNLQFSEAAVVVVMNPLEKMLFYVDPGMMQHGIAPAIGAALVEVLERYTFVLYSSPRPAVFLTWLIIPGIVLAWRRGERQAAVQAALLMLAAIGIDTLGVLRDLKLEYFTFTDPLIILAGALLLDRMPAFRMHRWAYPIGLALMAAHVALSQAEPVKQTLRHDPPATVCEWNQRYMPLLPVPWCDLPLNGYSGEY